LGYFWHWHDSEMTSVHKYLQFAHSIIIKIMKYGDQTSIVMPLHEKLEEYWFLILQRHPVFQNFEIPWMFENKNWGCPWWDFAIYLLKWLGEWPFFTSDLCFPRIFTMCQDALITAWRQIGVGYTTSLNVSTMKLVSSLLLIWLFVLQILIFLSTNRSSQDDLKASNNAFTHKEKLQDLMIK